MRDPVLTAAWTVVLVGGALLAWGWIGEFTQAIAPPSWVPLVGGLAMLLGFVTVRFAPSAIRRALPAMYDEPLAPRTRWGKGGNFEWQPAGQPMPYVHDGIAVRHTWWDAERGQRVVALLEFELPDESPRDVVHAATKTALARSADALPGRGKVQARATLEDIDGPTSLVHVRIEVQGIGANEAWARAATEAFVAAFLKGLARKGIDVSRRE